jgi:hypothetical protein
MILDALADTRVVFVARPRQSGEIIESPSPIGAVTLSGPTGVLVTP